MNIFFARFIMKNGSVKLWLAGHVKTSTLRACKPCINTPEINTPHFELPFHFPSRPLDTKTVWKNIELSKISLLPPCHAHNPPFLQWYLDQRAKKDSFTTIVIIFFAANISKSLTYWRWYARSSWKFFFDNGRRWPSEPSNVNKECTIRGRLRIYNKHNDSITYFSD